MLVDVGEHERPRSFILVDAEICRSKGRGDALAKKVGLGIHCVVGVLVEESNLSSVDRLHLVDLANGLVNLLGVAKRERCEDIVLRLRDVRENLGHVGDKLHKSLIVLFKRADPATELIHFLLASSHFRTVRMFKS